VFLSFRQSVCLVRVIWALWIMKIQNAIFNHLVYMIISQRNRIAVAEYRNLLQREKAPIA